MMLRRYFECGNSSKGFSWCGLFSFMVFIFKIQDDRIDTVSKSGRRRSIFKYMSEMSIAAAAGYFGPFHTIAIVGRKVDAFFADGFEEAGPAATAVEFAIAAELFVSTGGAGISTPFFMIPVFPGIGPFGSFFAGYMINISG